MSFRDQLYVARTALGYSQGRLGEIIKVSRQTVNNWETGKLEPHPCVQHLVLLLLDKLSAKKRKRKKKCITTPEQKDGGELSAKPLNGKSAESSTLGTKDSPSGLTSTNIQKDSERASAVTGFDFEFGKL